MQVRPALKIEMERIAREVFFCNLIFPGQGDKHASSLTWIEVG